jgi:rfaE bifunctional protein kinase chain/domain
MSKEKTVFVSGNFNVLHPGHLRLLRFASECGTQLIVGVFSDRISGEGSYVPEALRVEGVRSNSWVSRVILIDDSVTDIIDKLRPDIVVKGKEHQNTFNPEEKTLQSYGAKLLFSSGETTFSSLDILHKEFSQSTLKDITLPFEYMSRHSIDINNLKDLINGFSSLKVLVIGDLIIDEYITCEALGMSQEDPTIVVTPLDTTRFIGGAGIVAQHASGLGAQVEFVTVSGNDEAHDYAQNAFKKSGVSAHLIVDESRPTTIKQKFRSKGKSLLRVTHLHQDAINSTFQEKMIEIIDTVIQDIDLLVFSDFNYGCLPQHLVDNLTKLASEHNVMIAADSQSSSQIGDISRFRGANLITPTEREARISSRNHEDGLVVLVEQLKKESCAQNIFLKIGEEGMLVHSGDINGNEFLTDRIYALNTSPRDVAGAGDSLLISGALTMAGGGSIWEAAIIGSLAAAIQVGRVGNTSLKSKELLKELT